MVTASASQSKFMVLSGIAKAPHTRAAFLKTKISICATISVKFTLKLLYTCSIHFYLSPVTNLSLPAPPCGVENAIKPFRKHIHVARTCIHFSFVCRSPRHALNPRVMKSRTFCMKLINRSPLSHFVHTF